MFVSVEATILHADLDSFFASVEQRDDPRLRGRPVIVGAGVVLAASYEAKAFGVRTAMGSARARRLCPQAIVVPPRFEAYSEASEGRVRGLRRHDAARRGALDRRGVPRRARDGADRRHAARDRGARCGAACASEVGLPITVGVARTKFLAKVASGVAKPDGLLVVPPDGELAFLHPLPVERLWGVGPVTAAEAARRRASRPSARSRALRRGAARSSLLGRAPGRHLHALAHNRDPRPVERRRRRRSIGSQRALGPRGRGRRASSTPTSSRSSTASRGGCARPSRVGRTVVLRLRFDDFTRATRSHTLPQRDGAAPRRSSRAARELLDDGDADDRAARASRSSASRVANLDDALPRPARAAARRTHDRGRSTRRSTRCASGSARRRSRAACSSAATAGSRCRCCPISRA